MDATTIIEACGGTAAVARATGAPVNTVTYWRRRGSIPATYWQSLVGQARTIGAAVTLETLAAHRAPRSDAARV